MNYPNNPNKQNLEAFQGLVELERKERNLKFQQSYFKAYVLSAILPPIGIYYLIKFCFFSNGTDEDIKAGVISLIITIVSLFFSIWFFAVLFKQTTSKIPEKNLDIIKEMITPENQKKYKELFQ